MTALYGCVESMTPKTAVPVDDRPTCATDTLMVIVPTVE
jgi:hypothetical protein